MPGASPKKLWVVPAFLSSGCTRRPENTLDPPPLDVWTLALALAAFSLHPPTPGVRGLRGGGTDPTAPTFPPVLCPQWPAGQVQAPRPKPEVRLQPKSPGGPQTRRASAHSIVAGTVAVVACRLWVATENRPRGQLQTPLSSDLRPSVPVQSRPPSLGPGEGPRFQTGTLGQVLWGGGGRG